MPDDPTANRRTIRVDALARVEGEGALTIELNDGEVADVRLRIFEAPRFFESFLRGREAREAPDVTARICGICPVAYQMTSCHAVESAFGVEVPGPIRDLRRLLYCGEWIESHVLHVVFLHAPDFLGYESAIAMAKDRPEYAERTRDALRLKKVGNAIVRLVGGREVHPINVRLGGFYATPKLDDLRELARELTSVRELARGLLRWTSQFDFPDVEHDYEFVALRHDSEYPMNHGRVASNRGLDAAAGEFPDHFEEYQVPHSNALQCRRKEGGAYFVGPLARWNLNADRLPAEVRELADEAGLPLPCFNPARSIIARSLEVVFAVDEAIRLIESFVPPTAPFVECPPRAGRGSWITEAPRGMLFNRYETDADGKIVKVEIVPPTSQNQRRIEEDLIRFAPSILGLPEEEAALHCERVVRHYDPCISCATHFLKLNVVNR